MASIHRCVNCVATVACLQTMANSPSQNSGLPKVQCFSFYACDISCPVEYLVLALAMRVGLTKSRPYNDRTVIVVNRTVIAARH